MNTEPQNPNEASGQTDKAVDAEQPKKNRRVLIVGICVAIVLVVAGIICAYILMTAPVPTVTNQGSGTAKKIGEIVPVPDAVTDSGSPSGGGGSNPTNPGLGSTPDEDNTNPANSGTGGTPAGGNINPANPGIGGTTTPSGHWITVVDSPAWDEQVVDQPAWDQPTQVPVMVSNYDERIFYSAAEWDAMPIDYRSHGGYTKYVPGTPRHHEATYKTIHHPAITHQEWVLD